MITTKGTSPSPSRDEQKLNRPEGQGPADPKLSPDRTASKLGRLEGPPPADPQLSPPPDAAKRPGKAGRGHQTIKGRR
jgi:hypothetical protein